MRSALYLLIISLFVLSGCNNQSLESTEQSVSRTHQVKISLGDDFSSRSNRYKGNYNDVINGGSVVLYYAFPSGDNMTELHSNMSQAGTNWTVDLVLATGVYTFRAEAFDSAGVMIFDTDTPRTYPIDITTTNLSLGLQLNPILEDISGTPMPLITQLSKPSGYFPGAPMEIGFVVKGGSSDYLSFFVEAEIPAPDNNSSGTSVGNYLTSAELSSSDLDNISTYQGSIVMDIPAEATGPLGVIFGVGSETLESGTYIEFMVNQAVSVSSDNSTVVFVPTIEEFWLGSNADDNDTNTLQYWFEISGNQNFSDTVSFAFDGSSGSAQVTPMDSGYPSERMGTLYRSVLESGTLTITFASWDGQYSYSYHYDVPGGPTTQVDTYIPSPPNAIVDRYTLVWDQGNWDSQNWQ